MVGTLIKSLGNTHTQLFTGPNSHAATGCSVTEFEIFKMYCFGSIPTSQRRAEVGGLPGVAPTPMLPAGAMPNPEAGPVLLRVRWATGADVRSARKRMLVQPTRNVFIRARTHINIRARDCA